MLRLILFGASILLPIGAMAEEGFEICYRADAAPFSYIRDDGRPAGYSIDICMATAEALGVRPILIEVGSHDRFDALIDEKRCDMLCEATSITMGRRDSMEFSLITFLTGSALLYPIDLLDTQVGERHVAVGYLRGTTVAEHRRAGTLIGGGRAVFVFQDFDGHDSATAALLDGSIQSYIADREILQAILQSNPSLMASHQISRESITYEPYAIAVRLGDDRLRIALDRVLVDMFRSGTIGDLLAEHIPDRRYDPMLEDLFAIQSLPQ